MEGFLQDASLNCPRCWSQLAIYAQDLQDNDIEAKGVEYSLFFFHGGCDKKKVSGSH